MLHSTNNRPLRIISSSTAVAAEAKTPSPFKNLSFRHYWLRESDRCWRWHSLRTSYFVKMSMIQNGLRKTTSLVVSVSFSGKNDFIVLLSSFTSPGSNEKASPTSKWFSSRSAGRKAIIISSITQSRSFLMTKIQKVSVLRHHQKNQKWKWTCQNIARTPLLGPQYSPRCSKVKKFRRNSSVITNMSLLRLKLELYSHNPYLPPRSDSQRKPQELNLFQNLFLNRITVAVV